MPKLRSYSIAAAAALAVLLPAARACADESIVIGEQPWTGASVIDHILGEVIEARLNGDVSYVAADTPMLFAAAARNDRSVDVLPDVWLPNFSAAWAKYVDGGTRSLTPGKHPYVGTQGIYIPGYIQDKYGVKSVFDLKKPAIAKLFVPPEGGKAPFLVGAPGWLSTYICEVKARDYGLTNNFEPIATTASITYAKLDAANKTRRGVVFYAYTPNWIFSAYDLRRLKEPAFDGYAQDDKKNDPRYKAGGCWKFINPSTDPDWLNKSRIACAFPDAQVYVLAAKSLQKRAPKIAAFLADVKFDPQTLSALIFKVEKRYEPVESVAKDWIAANPATVNAWLAAK